MGCWTDFFKLWKYSKPEKNWHPHRVEDGISYIDVSGLSRAEAEGIIDDLKKEQERIRMEEIPDLQPSENAEQKPLCHVNGDAKLKGFIVMYIDVGQLPPFRAEAFVERLQDRFRPLMEKLPDDVGMLWIPVRPGASTRVEYMPLEG